MSNIILELKGTIDKYEGDAIIAFFGAPIDLEDHAYLAALSAVRMKKVEAELNRRFLDVGMSPNPLLTRVGINTGQMVVGNMGTPQKMDYTIMGNSVNLAARLEGVNKQYGTWVLAAQSVIDAAGGDFLVRRLDRVRVVGINQPVQLFELLDEKSLAPAATRELVETFDDGLALFEKRDWTRAGERFSDVLKISPEDGPAVLFRKRCTEYAANPPAESWDGVFSLGTK
jgi:adenylate cyclase